ncbi:sulfur carrier protein [Natranaerovirga hydrolytica]|uniref:Sulfur carrier protein n=1 Tax=Natranaerovirga hydrolytica TaxID=680378 RepID=A0A4R1MZI4_9FIRM|nr:sulfur carrier protein ThiS [Natranaerovirga hydrolytica]TCK98758.1 sulfur carrier protein [Natranaerovirga hydrolytica]
MIVKINGKEEHINEAMTLISLIKEKGLKPDRIVIEYNYDIIQKEKWQEITLHPNDNIEILSFVGGG